MQAPRTAAKKVLDVGQCGTDHWSVRRLIEGSFAAKVLAADDALRGAR